MTAMLPSERIERLIILIRGHRVMLDADLAVLYGVTTKRMNEQVRRNRPRFPKDFIFQLTSEEGAFLGRKLRPQTKAAEVGGMRRTPSQSKASPCCLRFSIVNVRSKRISRSCGPLFAYVKSLLQMHSSPEN